MDARQRAVELADEHDLHVVRITVEGVPDELRPRLVAEALAEVQALLEAEGRPVWWVESDEDAALVVADGLAMDMKAELVALEDDHLLGPWLNLDLVTVLEDGATGAWHRSPMRPRPRTAPDTDELARRVDGYDWSV
ncbi:MULTISPECIES: hypothetical protein [Luteococcus]|uniref:Uncharacterized protein n=1 Tax=Luteococcus japonicus LSP_Lj1 TaxID=1255658 RepID=A0A1R4IAC1_9ACTN|nr:MULTISPECIES: hypothetical protein [Luteococcus]MDN5562707.1 hypothetical protein [Luteococcus sp.]SJN16554.1 hypothetical protein FM114_00700 [Luteococcus japonicus LSP_Lj1]